MNKADQLAKRLEAVQVSQGMILIEQAQNEALNFDVIGDAMCIMHDDGSVNIIERLGRGVMTSEVISPDHVLKVLHHYRPFKDVLTRRVEKPS